MATPSEPSTAHSPHATRDDVRQICGEIDDDKANAVLALSPTVEDLEEAAAWLSGTGDLLSRAGHQLAGTIAAVVAIVEADEAVKAGVRR